MKKLIFLLLFSIGATITMSAQKKVSHVLRKYKNDENVMNINLKGDLTKMMADSEMDIKSKVELIDVLIFSKDTDVSDKHKAQIKNAINESGLELLVNVKDKDGRAKVYVRENDDHIEEVYAAIFAQGVHIHFILAGEIQYEDLANLNLGFEGSEFFNDAVSEKEEGADH